MTACQARGTRPRRGGTGGPVVWLLCCSLLLWGISAAAARSDQTLPPLGTAAPAHTPPVDAAAPQSPPVAAATGRASGEILPLGVRPASAATEARPHPTHAVRRWTEKYRGRTFAVIELPRCEHVEAVFSYEPSGETKDRARDRLGGFAVCTGSFHHPRTMDLADFLQKDGAIVSSATTGRWFFAVTSGGHFTISNNYGLLKGRAGVSAIALGQRLVPLHQDGFSRKFMNQVTERMALGLSDDRIYIVRGKSDIWRLAEFMQKRLPVAIAINSDGGHVVRGRAPVHIVFRWKEGPAPAAVEAITAPAGPKRPGASKSAG
jgi:hypothetical protein